MSSTIRSAPRNFLLAYPHMCCQTSQSSTSHSLLIIFFMCVTFMSLSGCVSFPSIIFIFIFFGSKEIDFQKNIFSIYWCLGQLKILVNGNQFLIGRKIMTLVAEIGLHFIFCKPFSTSPKTHQPNLHPPVSHPTTTPANVPGHQPPSVTSHHHCCWPVFAITIRLWSLPLPVAVDLCHHRSSCCQSQSPPVFHCISKHNQILEIIF